MTVYEEIKSIDLKKLNSLQRAGALRIDVLRNIDIYERFCYYRSRGETYIVACEHCADDFFVSDETVKKIIGKLKKEC